ncbi:MAG: nitrogen fixation protein NifH [Anaerolineae bacterium]|jgi:hypothetical protein
MTGPDPLPWLLEPENPSARYLALAGLLDRPAGDPEVAAAREAIPGWGPARAILDAQWPEGYWMAPGVGYSPKYKATVWQVIILAALGTPLIPAMERACDRVLSDSRLPDGRFSAKVTEQGAIACLGGNLLRALMQLGCQDPRLAESIEAHARMVLRDGFCCRYNALQDENGEWPRRMRDGLPCAWGAIKTLGALAEVPEEKRSPAVREAIDAGTALLLEGNLAAGDYATVTEPSPLWQQFGFPLGYTSDLLEALEVLGKLGADLGPQLAPVLEVVRSKREASGRWALEHTLDNSWATFGELGRPNKWVTLRALRALKWWG